MPRRTWIVLLTGAAMVFLTMGTRQSIGLFLKPVVDDLDTLTSSPYGNGWLVKIRVSNESGLDDLLDHAAYRNQCKEEQD